MTFPRQPITYARIEIHHGESIRFIEVHGTDTAPIDGSFASAEDDGYVTVELRLRGRTSTEDEFP